MALVTGNDTNNNPNNKSYERALAAKMQLILDQPTSDIGAKLVNHDFEGDFFKLGDTVTIVKPDVSSVEVQVGDAMTDEKLAADDLEFTSQFMVIDKCARYAFLVSDVTKAEGKWNYESGGLDIAAQETRKKMNLELCNLIANDANITRLGTPAAPIACASVDDLYDKVIKKIYGKLYNEGAITADGTYTFGSNPQESKATSAGIFMPIEGIEMLLGSKYLTDRSTTAADDKVATANIKQVLGMDLGIEPALSQASARKITVASLADNTFVVIAGTMNTVTEAKKVLPPEKQRSHTRFADEFHGMTIYGRKVISPKSAVVAFVQFVEA